MKNSTDQCTLHTETVLNILRIGHMIHFAVFVCYGILGHRLSEDEGGTFELLLPRKSEILQEANTHHIAASHAHSSLNWPQTHFSIYIIILYKDVFFAFRSAIFQA